MNDYPNLAIPKTNCCGCGLCKIICPKGAIEMKTDDEGFTYPVINKKKCVKCGACLKNCVFKKRK